MAVEPLELRVSGDRKTLTVVFPEVSYALPAELLRVCSPSADIRGHGGQWQIVSGKAAVSIYKIKAVGNYAVQLVFSDGHSSGIYSWEVLADLGQNRDKYWEQYLAALERLGKSRERK